MPKRTPDRDDSRGNLGGQGGPQDGRVDTAGGGSSGSRGEGGQRHDGGSSRDSRRLGGKG